MCFLDNRRAGWDIVGRSAAAALRRVSRLPAVTKRARAGIGHESSQTSSRLSTVGATDVAVSSK
jgi:hypothetical protein